MAVTKTAVLKLVEGTEDWFTFAQIERGIKSSEDDQDDLRDLLRKLVRDGYLVKDDSGNSTVYSEAELDK